MPMPVGRPTDQSDDSIQFGASRSQNKAGVHDIVDFFPAFSPNRMAKALAVHVRGRDKPLRQFGESRRIRRRCTGVYMQKFCQLVVNLDQPFQTRNERANNGDPSVNIHRQYNSQFHAAPWMVLRIADLLQRMREAFKQACSAFPLFLGPLARIIELKVRRRNSWPATAQVLRSLGRA